MANSHLLHLSLCILFLFHGCFAQLERHQQQLWQNLQQQQQHRLKAKTQCNIQRLNAQKPSQKIKSEAGVTEFWDSNSQEFECAGVEVERKVIQPKGLLLPHYSNAPKLIYIIQGSGVHGAVFPGCAETYESESRSQEGGSYGGQGQGEGQQRSRDRHQKLRRLREGDILAMPAGVTYWTYNDGEVPMVTVALIDVANEANQLDLNYRKFFLAGNPQGSQQGQGQGQQGGQYGQGGQQGGQQQEGEVRNIFNGFDDQLLANAFNVDPQIIRRLKGQQDQRGMIVRVEQLQLAIPEYGQEEQQRQQGQYGQNGLEETLCSMKLRENIGQPSSADLFNPRAGRISTVNSHTLPVLSLLQLSAERGFLYSNAIFAPQWTMNAHSALYVIRGSARIQVVGNAGNSVFDDQVEAGQLIIVPQNFAVVKKAGNQGFEYIAFKTNDNAMSSSLAGRLSTIRAIPEEVLMNSYRINRDEAKKLKYNRQEATLLSGSPGKTI